MRKESLWIITSAVVNRLFPYWGAPASLVYNALRGMNDDESEAEYMLTRYRNGIQGV